VLRQDGTPELLTNTIGANTADATISTVESSIFR
jgi:hypothetical protein